MFNVKRSPRTIHLPDEMWNWLDERCNITKRKRSQEIEYILNRMKDIEDQIEKDAFLRVEQSLRKQMSQQSPEEDDHELPPQVKQ